MLTNNIKLTRYEKVELVGLGIFLPIGIMLWATYLLYFYDEAIYLFDDLVVYFNGLAAYLVSCFWLGVSLALFSHFVLFKKHIFRLATGCERLAKLLIMVGLISALYYAFELNTLF